MTAPDISRALGVERREAEAQPPAPPLAPPTPQAPCDALGRLAALLLLYPDG
jgi:hypothetical protein